ncbi:MAG: hypothetical protein CMF38_02820 [Legionellaceae bacterium]|nr:hypothetical protein [Legionellaceae bacterium]|tara:strand:+ start:1095 stop:1811 length:717 start_codon:yes stop_codon:yes gene_type:complete
MKSTFFELSAWVNAVAKHPMDEEFKIERQAMRVLQRNAPKLSDYLTAAEQAQKTVYLDEHLFKWANGEVLNGQYNFCMTAEKHPRLICDVGLHHSYLVNGKKVLAAGELLFKQGQLLEITNSSGHYRLSNEEMLPFVAAMYELSAQTLLSYVSYSDTVPNVFSVEKMIKDKRIGYAQLLKENAPTYFSSLDDSLKDEVAPYAVTSHAYKPYFFAAKNNHNLHLPDETRDRYELICLSF